jgi:hypothetical protein
MGGFRVIRDVAGGGWNGIGSGVPEYSTKRLVSAKIYNLKKHLSHSEYYRGAQILPFEVSEQMRNNRSRHQ